MLPTGEVANQQRVRFTNQLTEAQAFTVELVAPEGATLVVSVSPIVVAADAVKTVNVVAKIPADAFVNGKVMGRYVIRSDKDFDVAREFILLGPYQ